MCVIGGNLKGRRLFSPRWKGLRPTSDRLRETLFDVLGNRIEGLRVLDGCAGTGALGIEALSRGADHAVFIERDARAVALIKRNLAHCSLERRSTVRRATIPHALRRPVPMPFDLVLLDPPYDAPDIGAILTAAGTVMASDGLLIVERSRRCGLPDVDGLKSQREVRAGNGVIEFYCAVASVCKPATE